MEADCSKVMVLDILNKYRFKGQIKVVLQQVAAFFGSTTESSRPGWKQVKFKYTRTNLNHE